MLDAEISAINRMAGTCVWVCAMCRVQGASSKLIVVCRCGDVDYTECRCDVSNGGAIDKFGHRKNLPSEHSVRCVRPKQTTAERTNERLTDQMLAFAYLTPSSNGCRVCNLFIVLSLERVMMFV